MSKNKRENIKYKGGIPMDIAALSTELSQMKLAQEASISVMKMAMDISKVQAVDLTQMLEANTKVMEQSITPHIGQNIDIKL
ncbi:YjfB family protein [Tissierella pigra]|uniref:YjfB family protein n=1 Tax=Tissierella pigra TaxID=2607614 RepID=UPI001FCFA4D0|nr:YjfB family protein [Tissierella pigra]